MARKDYSIVIGQTLFVPIRILENGVAKSISAYRGRATTTNVLTGLTGITLNVVVLDAPNGDIGLFVEPSQTSGLTTTTNFKYKTQLYLEDESDVIGVVEGFIQVRYV